ncbi:MAG TPA: DinB family protein, partial [Longimicrobiales bacterium]
VAGMSDEQADFAYAPGKWTIKQVVGHLADTERVMSARALCFARGEQAPLPAFDENAYVDNAGFEQRTLESLVQELRAVRAASVALFDGLGAEAWTRRGTASGHGITVRALAWVIVGHELHHRAILRERYISTATVG